MVDAFNTTYETGVAHRVRRDAPPYGPPAPAYAPPVHHGPKGRVGPVYTFVKTDPQVIRAQNVTNLLERTSFHGMRIQHI